MVATLSCVQSTERHAGGIQNGRLLIPVAFLKTMVWGFFFLPKWILTTNCQRDLVAKGPSVLQFTGYCRDVAACLVTFALKSPFLSFPLETCSCSHVSSRSHTSLSKHLCDVFSDQRALFKSEVQISGWAVCDLLPGQGRLHGENLCQACGQDGR